MKQPDLGLKVAELRQQKGLTQEQLAEYCHVSTRTIQRIESGEVNPRSHTMHCLHGALDFDFGEPDTSNEDVWLAAMHLSSMICIPVIPLLIWSAKKNRSCRIDQQGRQAINFQVTMALSLFAAAFVLMLGPIVLILLEKGGAVGGAVFAWLLIIAPLPLICIGIYCAYQAVSNAMRALSDKPVRYVPSIPFMK
jgi:transcriptional regulator with XRE-family HTH domain